MFDLSDYSYNHIKDNIIHQLDQKLIEIYDINASNLDQFITDDELIIDDCNDEIYNKLMDDLEHEYQSMVEQQQY